MGSRKKRNSSSEAANGSKPLARARSTTLFSTERGETVNGSPCSVQISQIQEATRSSQGTSLKVERSGFITISAKPCSQLLTLRLGKIFSPISHPKITSHCAKPSSNH